METQSTTLPHPWLRFYPKGVPHTINPDAYPSLAAMMDEAFARLRTLSQTEHQKLNAMAQSIVDQAVRRARSRHTDAR